MDFLSIIYAGFHTVGKGRDPPPPLDFRPNLLQHTAASQLQALWCPRNILRGLNFKALLGTVYMYLRPPQAVCFA